MREAIQPKDPLSVSGQVIAEKYEVQELVGEGGFALVYRAVHTIWNRPVAIKFFTALSSAPVDQRNALQREFIQEGALLTELSSQTAGIVQARDVGTVTTPDGQWLPYMVLEWLDGHNLEAILERDRRQGLPWSLDETLGFLQRLLPVLEVAHSRGVAHRDIKPANVFVVGSAARSTETPIKLLDFGVAKMVADRARMHAVEARTGLVGTAFTPHYGAPEQFARSFGATGPWTDVYAVALIVVEMLTGRDALRGEDAMQLGYASANAADRPTPRARGAKVPDGFEAVLSRALAVRPEDRFATAGEFLDATLAALGLPMRKSRSSVPPPLPLRERLQQAGASSPAGFAASAAPASIPSASPPSPTTNAGPADKLNVGGSLDSPDVSAPPPPRALWSSVFAALLVIIAGTTVFAVSDLQGAEQARSALSSMFDAMVQLASKIGRALGLSGS